MLSIYLSLALSLSRVPGSETEDTGLYLCDTSVEGDICESTGMAVYVTYSDPPTRPSTFYPISPSQWNFSEANILKYLGVSSSDAPNVSGKFSGVFTPTQTGSYTFQLTVQHYLSVDACISDMSDYDSFIDADLSYSGTGESYSLSCSVSSTNTTSLCIEYNYCRRKYYLVSGRQYPLFAGTRYNYTLPQTDNIWMRLVYTDPSSNTQGITDEAIAGLRGYGAYTGSDSVSSSSVSTSSASSGSVSNGASSSDGYTNGVDSGSDGNSSSLVVGSRKISNAVIGGVCSGIFVVIAVSAVIAWIVIMKKDDKTEPLDGDAFGRHKDSGMLDQRISGIDFRYGSGTRRENGRSSRRDTRPSSGRTSRSGVDHSGRMSNNRGSRASSGRTSRRNNDYKGCTTERSTTRVGSRTHDLTSGISSSHR